jgi:hypothetical protein
MVKEKDNGGTTGYLMLWHRYYYGIPSKTKVLGILPTIL